MFILRLFFCIVISSQLHLFANKKAYSQKFPGYFSQHGQDKFLNENIFKSKKNGIFIEIGAHDGISFSNTYFFEKHLSWTGICVEPILDHFMKLKHNRPKSQCENLCIDVSSGKKKFLRCSGHITEMYSGLLNNYDSRHLERIDREIKEFGGGKQVIETDSITFNDLIKKHRIKHVDILSLDTEGGEEAIVRSIDFNQVNIDVLVVENNFNEESMRSYLKSKGYEQIHRIGKDDIYKKKSSS